MRGRLLFWLAIGLALIDVLVPFLLLRRIGAFTGSFLFWCLLTMGVILFGTLSVRGWGGRS